MLRVFLLAPSPLPLPQYSRLLGMLVQRTAFIDKPGWIETPQGSSILLKTTARLIWSLTQFLLITALLNCGNWHKRSLMFALFRAISVILGDKWKAMKQEDRREYVIQAKLLADEHKRVNPDCWKRKRNSEVS